MLKNGRYMSIYKVGRASLITTMSNIPLIHQNRVSGSPLLRRANKVIASEHTKDNIPTIKRRLERRRNNDRRQMNTNVLFDRRRRGIHRRKNLSAKQVAAELAGLSDTVGKNIDTTA